MVGITEALDRLKINARSPDGSVVARYTSEGILVDLSDQAMARHSGKALSAQVEQALRSLIAAYQKARTMIDDKLFGDTPLPPKAAKVVAERQRRLAELMRRVDIDVESSRGTARVGLKANGDVSVTLATRLHPDIVRNELNEAVTSAFAEYGRHRANALRVVYPVFNPYEEGQSIVN